MKGHKSYVEFRITMGSSIYLYRLFWREFYSGQEKNPKIWCINQINNRNIRKNLIL